MELKYNRQGEVTERKDQNGTVHQYLYDALGRQTADKVTTVGTDVDSTVRRIERSYEVRGMLEKTTSYDAVTGGNPLNEVVFEFGTSGLLSKEYQEHSGAKDGSTLYAGYNYDSTASSGAFTKGLRRTSVRYPNGRLVHFTYGSSGEMNDALNRLAAINDDSSGSPGSSVAEYTYLGTGTIAVEDYPEPDVKLNYDSGTAGEYAGFDRFGRVVDHLWRDYGASEDRDRYTYGYDRASNRLYRENTTASGKDEFYTYDGVNQLKTFDRGDLNAGKTAISGTPVREEDWTLDMTGNWSGYVQKTSGSTDLSQTRGHNKSNEITSATSWATPVHDRAGNMTTVPKPSTPANGLTLKYDAWNRLVEVKDGQTVVGKYQYDGRNRRIKKHIDSQSPASPNGIDRYEHFFYNSRWQILETRDTTTESDQAENLQPKYQYVWSARYIDAPVLRDQNTDTDGLCDDERMYYLGDANFNVTSLAHPNGDVLERYLYDPYGEVRIHTADWSSRWSASSHNNYVLYSGRELDGETGLNQYRYRYYVSQLGRFSTRDPLHVRTNDLSLYTYARACPTQFTDSHGLQASQPAACEETLADYLAGEYALPGIPGTHQNTMVQCNVNIQCGDCPGTLEGYTYAAEGYVHVCVDSSMQDELQILHILIHEAAHAAALITNDNSLCHPRDPWEGECPEPPPLIPDCRTCVRVERAAYRISCASVYGRASVWFRWCVNHGLYTSCHHACPGLEDPPRPTSPAPPVRRRP